MATMGTVGGGRVEPAWDMRVFAITQHHTTTRASRRKIEEKMAWIVGGDGAIASAEVKGGIRVRREREKEVHA